MGRSACCEKVGLKKGPWTPEEDQKLLAYIEEQGHGSWRSLPSKAGLQRCGKSCRLRWTNYLRPDIKRGKFSLQEEQAIIQLHALLGNRWSAIATHLPKRTDNEIKNYWNTHLKKRLAKMGIDPVTHKQKNDALLSSDGQSKSAAKLSHMAQWESARLEAEARLARESKLRSQSFKHHPNTGTSLITSPLFKSWMGSISKASEGNPNGVFVIGNDGDLESPTSTITLLEGANGVIRQHSKQMIEFVGASGSLSDPAPVRQEGKNDWKGLGGSNSIDFEEIKEGIGNTAHFMANCHEITRSGLESPWNPGAPTGNHHKGKKMGEGFTSLLLNSSSDHNYLSDNGGDEETSGGGGTGSGDSRDSYEDNKNYWNSILNFVNSSLSESPMF